jgi:4-amino-4-deoxychorismate lyase
VSTSWQVDTKPVESVHPGLRALHYGDGLFETSLVRQTQVAWLERHLQRLRAGCMALRLDFSDWGGLTEELEQKAAEIGNGVIKTILSRAPGGRGYRFEAHQGVTRIVSTHPLPDYPPERASQGVRVRVCELRLGLQPRLAGIKHLNRLEQVMARAEWGDEYEEGLMLDYNGQLIEGTMTNLFVERDGVLLTPPLNACGVAGVMRSVLLDLAGQLGVQTRREVLRLADLERADGLFLCNSLAGIWPVRSVAGLAQFGTGPLTQQLQQVLSRHSGMVPGNWYSW